MAKWFVYQVEPTLLSESNEQEDLEGGFPSDESSNEDLEGDGATSTGASHYPPTDAILEEMIRYQRASKRIPSTIPPGILATDVPLSNHLIPSEEVCHICHSSLGDPREVSNKAMIIGLTKVSSGDLFFSITLVHISIKQLSQLQHYLPYRYLEIDTQF